MTSEWHLYWQNETRRRLTARFIGDLGAWLNRKSGETEQDWEGTISLILCFAVGLWDDAHHTFFLMEGEIGFVSTGDPSPDNIVAHYIRVLLVEENVELDRWKGRIAGVV